MQRLSPPSSFLASVLFSFASAFALGCVISVGPGGDDAGIHECGSLLAHNDANCVCDAGYERCNPNSSDTDCCEKEGKGGECEPNSYLDGDDCYCNSGYTWCNPDDLSDLTCCVDPGQTSQGTGTESGGETVGTSTETVPTTSVGTTGAPQECLEAVDPPASCDVNTESFFCTNPESCGPYGGVQYYCENGVWVEDTSLNEACQLDGKDFSYGCIDSPADGVVNLCGDGSGAACDGGGATCSDSNTWTACQWGKQSEADCFVLCTEEGDSDGATYDFGSCEVQDGEAVCACCDEGEEGCPINEPDTTTGDDSTGGDTSSTG
jgi:hypothetical protein